MTPGRVAALLFRASLASLALVLAFVLASVAGLVLHLNLPALRRVVGARVESTLASSLRGRLVVDSVGRIDFGGVDEANVRVLDPSGKLVAAAYGVRARITLAELGRSLLAPGPLAVHLTDVSARAVDVDIDVDASGQIGIQRAFASRAPSSPSSSGRGVRLTIDRLELRHAWVHGLPAAGLPIDADVDAVGASVAMDPSRVAVDVRSFTLATRGMPLGANATGTAEAHLVVPSPKGGALGASLAWKGSVAGIEETARGSIDGDAIDATVDAPEVSPAAVRALWPASPIETSAAAHVDVQGALPKLQVRVRASHGPASLDVSGPVVLGAGQSADLQVAARDVDLHGIVSSAPTTRLSVTGEVTLARSAAGALNAKAALTVPEGSIAGESIPSGKIRATFSQDAKSGIRAEATVTANEPGAPTVLSAQLVPKGRSFELTFQGDTRVPALDAVPRLGPGARGRTEIRTRGVVDFGRGELDVKLVAEIHGLGHNVLTVEHVSLDARARGTLASPQVDVTLHGDLLDFGGYRFSGAQLDVHGPASGAAVHASLDADGDGTPEITLDGRLSVGAVTKVDQIQVHVARMQETVAVTVGEIRVAHGELSVAPIAIEGLGGPVEASFQSNFGTAHVLVRGDSVDLARLERVSNKEGFGGCMAAVDVDLSLRRDGADGHASIELTRCTVQGVTGGTAGLEAMLKGRTIAGRAHAELEDVGSLVLTAPAIEVGGTETLPESWKKAFGRVKFDGKVDVAKLAAKLPRHSVPLDHVRGVVTFQGRVQRDSPTDDTPGFNLSLTTAGLSVVGPSSRSTGVDGSPVLSAPMWRMDGVDVGLDARIDGDTGFAAVSARLTDPKGALVAFDVKSGTVPYGAMLDKPGQALGLLQAVPFNANVVVPPRDVKELPPVLALKGIQGELSGGLSATGTPLAPVVDLAMKLAKGRVSEGVAFPIDFDLAAHYDGAHASAELYGVAKKKGRVLDAHFVADALASDLIHGHTSAWSASASAHLDGLPLASISALADRQVSGTVTGDLTLDGLHKDGRASLSLNVQALKVGDVVYREGFMNATLDGTGLAATLHLEQADGTLDATAQAGSKWGTALLPALDPSRAPSGEVNAKSFRLALLLPFVDETFTELDGRLDGDVRATVDPTSGRGALQGTVALSQGRFELASVGGEFHDVTAKATLTPDGLVKVEGVKALAMSGVVQAAASARLSGFALTGANATVEVPSASPLRLTVQGSQVGTVEGRVDVAVLESASAINVRVNLPTLHVELPLAPGRDVQALGQIEGVRVGIEKSGGTFVAERLDAPRELVTAPAGKTIVATVVLGKDVVVRKSTQLNVSLSGNPVLTIGAGVQATGQVSLLGGKIDVQGKSFDIDSGTVTFSGDPADPQMVITASWTAADGTEVFADLRGTLKNPKVTLRSEPSLSPNEIIALLVYGSADATTPNSGAAAGVAGGAATQPLNRALENMGLGGVSTRVDTSAQTPRADVEVQIARDLSLQIAEVMGIPPPGTNPDVTLLTLNWRFARAWSAQSTIGNAGTTIWDLIWQYRY